MSEEGATTPQPSHLVRVLSYKRSRTGALCDMYAEKGYDDVVRADARRVFAGIKVGDELRAEPLSLYAAFSAEHDTVEYALGVLAVVLGNDPNFGESPRADIPCQMLTTLFVELAPLLKHFRAELTPMQCTVFSPARELHWDLHHDPTNAEHDEALMSYLIKLLAVDANVAEVVFKSGKEAARGQVLFSRLAQRALDHCRRCYGLEARGDETSPGYDVASWSDAAGMKAAEQVRRLRVIALQRRYDWSAEP
jgi:hypothetical protein